MKRTLTNSTTAIDLEPDVNRHVYLYAKYHYRRTDFLEDLRLIFARRNAIEPRYVYDGPIVGMVLEIVYPHIRGEHQWGEIIGRILEIQPWETTVDPVSLHDLFNRTLGALLGVLSMVKVLDEGRKILELGEPDPGLLPLNDVALYQAKTGTEPATTGVEG